MRNFSQSCRNTTHGKLTQTLVPEVRKLHSKDTTLNIRQTFTSSDFQKILTWNRHKPVQHSKSIPASLTSEEPRRHYYCKKSEAGDIGTASRCLGLFPLLRSFKQMQGIFAVPSEELPLECLEMLPVLLVLFLPPEGAVLPVLQAPVDREDRR